MCATIDDDISALLDEMELENYVSFLQDESVFQELSRLELPKVLTNSNGGGGDETDEILDFHDALDYFQLHDNSSGCDGSINTVEPSSIPPLMPPAMLCVETELHCSNNDTVLPNKDPLTTTTQYTDSTAVVSDIVTQQNIVRHDHTYAADTPATINPTTDSVILASTSLDSSIIETSKSSGSDTDESNTSDTSGYDTVTVSPSSTRSSFSSTLEPSKALSSVVNPVTPPLSENFSKLITDPVKLIDERIQFFMNRQEVDLTEEEKDTLRSEGLPIPTTLPLTKTEERALKTVRRKIRNKIAAQESRKKKKQYMQCLEEKVQQCTQENRKLHKKVHSLETENKTLLQQLAQLQLLVAHANPILGRQVNIGRCLMVVVLCFGVLCGNLLPYRVSVAPANDYSTSAVRSRSLLSLDSSTNWFKWTEYFSILSPTVHTLTNDHYYTNSVASSLQYYRDNSTLCFDLHH